MWASKHLDPQKYDVFLARQKFLNAIMCVSITCGKGVRAGRSADFVGRSYGGRETVLAYGDFDG